MIMEVDILNELAKIRQLTLIGAKQALSLSEAATLLGISKSHLYKMCHFKKVPYYKSGGGKHTFFNRDELNSWMLNRRIKTDDELASEAANYVVNKGNKGGVQ